MRYNDNDYNDYGDEDEVDVKSIVIDEDEEDEVEDNRDIRDAIDDEDIVNCFDDAHVSTKTTIGKRKRKEKVVYNVGDAVIYRKKSATVLYGPYERGVRQMYELQLSDGSVVSATATAIKKTDE